MNNNKNIKCEVSYDGSNYHGFQYQPNARTVQGELINSIYKLTKESTKIIASGRTDAGVHARKQVCNFYTNSSIPADKWTDALNSVLPKDIIVIKTEEVPFSFHSRFDVKRKTYRYSIYHNKINDVFRRNYSWFIPYPLSTDKMKQAVKLFIGVHDFTSFSSAKSDTENKIREIYDSKLWMEDNEIIFEITGNGFLYNMVRIIVGTLVEIGRGKMPSEEISNLLKQKNRIHAGVTAPPQGLILWDVLY